ncbi:DHA1 family multidrug resistance protein-like MFS transporter [Hydrogenispora ethanolica]|jgi:MFS family permease|uniref:DHA1 family multidrug resistance protein-like MFS transporter n=1 Tax=Hydrogenispora ethanolica TaxID=1082276 RepID=A0A4V2QCU8_HYDET|nr:MFS transporter [Hydrogenispora ethanolica]TCL61817.1 DHA1 family multidrug resistance protein-like MFS transporter [Hydrogenispora ethanolica]
MTYYQRNLLILSFTIFLAAFSWEQIAPYLPLFLKELGITKDLPFWSGLLFTLQFLASSLMGPIWGKMADKYGRKPMVMRAGICLSAVYFGMSFCQNYGQLLFLRIMNGMLTGFIPGSIALIATNTPKQESGRFVSIAYTAQSAGVILGPALGGVLAAVAGYRSSMLLSAGLVLFAFILVTVMVEEREKPQAVAKTSIMEDIRYSFKMPVMVTVMSVEFVNALVMSALLPILALYLHSIAPDANKMISGFIYSMPGLALFLTAYSWSRVGEKISYTRTIIIGLTGVGLVGVLLGLVGNIWLFAVLYFIYGTFVAAVSPSSAALIATRVDADFRGRAYAMQQTARTIGLFVAPVVSGLIGNFIGLNWIFIVFGAAVLLLTLGVRTQIRSWDRPERGSIGA